MSHQCHKSTLKILCDGGLVTRLHEKSVQILAVGGRGIYQILRPDASNLVKGSKLKLYRATAAGGPATTHRRRFDISTEPLQYPVWDSWSSAVYGIHDNKIIRIAGDEVSLLEPSNDDVDVGQLAWLASDGAGALYCIAGMGDSCKVCKWQLPAALWASPGGPLMTSGADVKAVVSTLAFEINEPVGGGLVYVGDPAGPGSLVYATDRAMYRVKLGCGDGVAAPVVLVGDSDDLGSDDGEGSDACSYVQLGGLAVDVHGNVIFTQDHGTSSSVVRCVGPDGTTKTLTVVEARLCRPCIFPDGHVAFCNFDRQNITVLGLGLVPQPLAQQYSLQLNTLSSDWAALLKQPDATFDLSVCAGGQVFPVQRLVLSVRSAYFRQRLAEAPFTEDNAVQLTLTDVSPEAFMVALCFIYTGAVSFPSALACPVAELADRLLLTDLCNAACKQVLVDLTVDTVVDRMLWAERCAEVWGGSFREVLLGLKTWYVNHYSDVKRGGARSMRDLAATHLDLVLDLYEMRLSILERSAKRPRH